MRRYSLRRRYGRATSWQGTDYIERRWFSVQPMIASAYLNRDTHEQGRIAILRARDVLAWMRDQRPAPNAKTRRWMAMKIGELERLIAGAERNYP